MDKKIIIGVAVLVLVFSLTFITSSMSIPKAHANPTIWFISYMTTDNGYINIAYSYTFSWADTQVSTITITNDWGDSITDTTTSNGICCEPPNAYSHTVTISHTYNTIGIFKHTVTLSDSTGASSINTVIVTIGYPNNSGTYNTGGLGGGGKPLIPT